MRKFISIISITLVLSFCLSGCGNDNQDLYNNDNYTASKVSTSNNDTTNNVDNNINNDVTNTTIDNNTDSNNDKNITTESDISSFSTKIYTPNDEARQNNIQITCSKLNGTIVKSRRNFFFL